MYMCVLIRYILMLIGTMQMYLILNYQRSLIYLEIQNKYKPDKALPKMLSKRSNPLSADGAF